MSKPDILWKHSIYGRYDEYTNRIRDGLKKYDDSIVRGDSKATYYGVYYYSNKDYIIVTEGDTASGTLSLCVKLDKNDGVPAIPIHALTHDPKLYNILEGFRKEEQRDNKIDEILG